MEERNIRTAMLIGEKSVGKLKAYASAKKLPTPEFRDLGESLRSNERVKEFVIECRLGGRCVSATAPSKQEARAIAAEKLLSEIELAEAPATKEESRAELVKKSSGHSQHSAKAKSPSPKKAPHYHKKRS